MKMIHTLLRHSARLNTNGGKRALSRGALPGGFTEEGLLNYAKLHWELNDRHDSGGEGDGDDLGLRSDLFSHKISPECTEWLDSHEDPSGALGNAYFGSPQFLPERIVLSPLSPRTAALPRSFQMNELFLGWKVVMKAPLELICEHNAGSTKMRGLTMVAFDPSLQRIYHGNCVDGSFTHSKLFEALVPLHEKYAKFLLKGMGNVLEKEALKSKL